MRSPGGTSHFLIAIALTLCLLAISAGGCDLFGSKRADDLRDRITKVEMDIMSLKVQLPLIDKVIKENEALEKEVIALRAEVNTLRNKAGVLESPLSPPAGTKKKGGR
ncbi:MAG: hypothetical protein RDV48_14495 [Candidatus Eremiobacteraeota bacterium]|nr:hypothetical protein [Candidatus Eremiobacteraeota bacterium]